MKAKTKEAVKIAGAATAGVAVGRAMKAVGAAVAGAAVGYAAGVLTAPASGARTRRQLKNKLEDHTDFMKRKAKVAMRDTKAKVVHAFGR